MFTGILVTIIGCYAVSGRDRAPNHTHTHTHTHNYTHTHTHTTTHTHTHTHTIIDNVPM